MVDEDHKKGDLKELWQELMKESKFGIADIKITSNYDDKLIIEYLKKHKTKDKFAFSRDDISKGTGIPTNKLPYTSIVKIPNVEFLLVNGNLRFTYITIWEKLKRLIRYRLVR